MALVMVLSSKPIAVPMEGKYAIVTHPSQTRVTVKGSTTHQMLPGAMIPTGIAMYSATTFIRLTASKSNSQPIS